MLIIYIKACSKSSVEFIKTLLEVVSERKMSLTLLFLSEESSEELNCLTHSSVNDLFESFNSAKIKQQWIHTVEDAELKKLDVLNLPFLFFNGRLVSMKGKLTFLI